MKARPLTYYAWLSMGTALATMALKAAAWWVTGSVGLLSDALESGVNLAGSVMALTTLTVAARPPDADHAFGHGRPSTSPALRSSQGSPSSGPRAAARGRLRTH